jgi:hypothetical protein
VRQQELVDDAVGLPVALQNLAGTFSDKASLLVDLNERALALRTGGFSCSWCLLESMR